MTAAALSFGTLNTTLAKDQTTVVMDLLQATSPRQVCQMQIIPSPVPPAQQEGEPFLAASTREVEFLEEQLLAGEFRVMIVRASDMVLPLRTGVEVLAVPRRSTPYDALLNRRSAIIDDLDEETTIGVLNLRSRIQMQALWPHLNFILLHGGLVAAIDALLRHSEVDALVAPAAVAEHLGLQSIVSEIFNPEMVLPAGGQGILTVLGREDDHEAKEILAPLHSPETACEMTAEHAFLQRFASDQDLPLSVLARCSEGRLTITGAVGSPHEDDLRRVVCEGPAESAAILGVELAEKLLTQNEADKVIISLLEADFPEGLPEEESEDETLESELDPDVLEELKRLSETDEDT